MGFYSRFILPRVLELACSQRPIAQCRATVIPKAAGVVLELGMGSGLNLPFYSGAVKRLYGIDPSSELLRRARERASQVPFPVEIFNRPADRVPLEDQSMDTVVSTWVMCSIPDVPVVLRELRRVLKPDGRLLFVEHGHSPDPAVQKWQNRLTPLWQRIGGGCRLNKKIDELIRSAGFHIEELDAGYLAGPRPLSYTYRGRARAE